MISIPTGTVTFLFTDIEGSTKLWQQYPDQMKANLARHDALLRTAIEQNDGYVFKTVGDAFCAAFPTGLEGVQAAIDAQKLLAGENWGECVIKVRMGLHTGDAEQRDNDYFGNTLNRVARLSAAGHGGQTLLSLATQELVQNQLPDGATLADFGERRLKDLIRPEHIYQLNIPGLPADFAPLKTLDIFRTNLPGQLTSFIGREKEIADVKKLLGENRLVTLTGVGGTGKTRLSLQIASTLLDEFPGGAWFVELASITNPDVVPQAVTSTLELYELVGRDHAEALANFLEKREVLLILDNCEHLLLPCAQLAGRLLQRCTRLKIIATSREPLGITGETIWSVPSFSTPQQTNPLTPKSLRQFDAVKLFIDRARAVQPGFDLTDSNAQAVAQICTRLDGIPLALELAAARVRGMSVEQIASRLDSRFRLLTGGSRTALPRQQTLSALVDWSYNLLSEPEKLLFQRLAVFSGPFTLETAEQVCSGEEIGEFDILDLLQRLMDKSLVLREEHHNETFYRLLETIRQYGREKLLASDMAEEITNRHAACFLKIAIQSDVKLRSHNQLAWFHRLGVLRDNLRAALAWLIETGQTSNAFTFATKLDWVWFMHAEHSEGRQWLERVLEMPDTEPYRPERTRALTELGFHTWLQISSAKAQPIAEKALSAARAHNDRWNLAFALAIMALVQEGLGNWPASHALSLESMEIFKELGDRWNTIHATFIHSRDEADLRETAAAFHEIGDDHMQFPLLLTLSYHMLNQNRPEETRQVLRDGLLVAQEFNNKMSIALILSNFSEFDQINLRPERAVSLAWAARNIYDQIGAWGEHTSRTDAELEKWAAPIREKLGESIFNLAVERGSSMSLEQTIEFALHPR